MFGGSIEAFVDDYGDNSLDESETGLLDYMSEDEYVRATFVDDQAILVSIHFEYTDYSERSEEEALEAAEIFMPEDSELKESEIIEAENQVMSLHVYESNSLQSELGTENTDAQLYSVRIMGFNENGYTYVNIEAEETE